jgi:hypothetical protein
MAGANAPTKLGSKLLGPRRVLGNQDDKTVKLLRLGVGVIGILLPIAIIVGNWVLDDKVIVPSSISGSYYTSTRNLFVGALCALGVFLIGYRHTERQNRCTWFAGACALVVAFAPTAPSPPETEPAWINYLHHAAAGALIFTLGLFCWVVFADYAQPGEAPPESLSERLKAWWTSARDKLKRDPQGRLYLICGFLVFAAGALALYTGVWPTSWSTGWQSLYLFETVAVIAFGVAWIVAGLTGAKTRTQSEGDHTQSQRQSADSTTVSDPQTG